MGQITKKKKRCRGGDKKYNHNGGGQEKKRLGEAVARLDVSAKHIKVQAWKTEPTEMTPGANVRREKTEALRGRETAVAGKRLGCTEKKKKTQGDWGSFP